MKKITIRPPTDDSANLIDLIKAVVGNSPSKPMTVDEMRRRVTLLDSIDAMKPDQNYFLVEDADYKILVSAFETFPWQQASRTLVNLIEDIQKAEVYSFLKLIDGKAAESKEAS